MQASLTSTLTYITPGPLLSSPLFMIGSVEYTASSAGFVDVPDATASGVAFSIPFGAVAEVKGVVLQNNTTQQLNVRFNGAEADEFSIPPGGLCVPLFGTTASLDEALTEIELVTSALVDEAGTIAFVVLGDE